MAYQINGTNVFFNEPSGNSLAVNRIKLFRYSSNLLSMIPDKEEGSLVYVWDANDGNGGLYYWTGSAWEPAPGASPSAFGSGGIKTESAGFTYHVFGEGTSSFAWTGGEIEVLMAAGGGGGGAGRSGGGGGAGGFAIRNLYLAAGSHTVVVGAGGNGESFYSGPVGSRPNNATNGGNTYISVESGDYYVKGGGKGSVASGGSGGGGDSQQGTSGGGTGGPGLKNPGGSGGGSFPGASNLSAYIHGAGGGGSSTKGGDAPRSGVTNGAGGQGHLWPQFAPLNPSGSPTAWMAYTPAWAPAAPSNISFYGLCGGGGGGRSPASPQTNTPTTGGGGNGTNGNGIAALCNGAGGGGGGWNGLSNYPGGPGVKGLLIVRYPTP